MGWETSLGSRGEQGCKIPSLCSCWYQCKHPALESANIPEPHTVAEEPCSDCWNPLQEKGCARAQGTAWALVGFSSLTVLAKLGSVTLWGHREGLEVLGARRVSRTPSLLGSQARTWCLQSPREKLCPCLKEGLGKLREESKSERGEAQGPTGSSREVLGRWPVAHSPRSPGPAAHN